MDTVSFLLTVRENGMLEPYIRPDYVPPAGCEEWLSKFSTDVYSIATRPEFGNRYKEFLRKNSIACIEVIFSLSARENTQSIWVTDTWEERTRSSFNDILAKAIHAILTADTFEKCYLDDVPPWFMSLEFHDQPYFDQLTKDQATLRQLDDFPKRIDRQLESILGEFKSFLLALEGNSWSYQWNRHVVSVIQDTLDRLKSALRCPSCGRPGRLRCRRSGRSREGTFQFDHTIEGKKVVHGGSAKLPKLETIPPGPDLRKVPAAAE